MVNVVHWLGKDVRRETDEFMSSLIRQGLGDAEILAAHLGHFFPKYDLMLSSMKREDGESGKVSHDTIIFLDEPGKRFRQR